MSAASCFACVWLMVNGKCSIFKFLNFDSELPVENSFDSFYQSDRNGENWPGGPLEPGFIVSPLAWTTSTSRPPFLSIRPISMSPRFMKTDSRVRGNICVYIFFLLERFSIRYPYCIGNWLEKESRADPGPRSTQLTFVYFWLWLRFGSCTQWAVGLIVK